jgi:hypothetical protein
MLNSVSQTRFSVKRKIREGATLLGSITDLAESDRGLHVLAGSHGGEATGRYALGFGVASLICHDAGIGLDDAGVLGLAVLDAAGVAAAAVSHDTARIGDPADMLARGLISRINTQAGAVGLRPGMPTSAACTAIQRATVPAPQVRREDAVCFGRFQLDIPSRDDPSFVLRVVVADSASSLSRADDGCVAITGSHGGLPGSLEHT